ncbi:hypothetical protein EJ110_NYTH36670 [Nymphaea thermarum]|nr:hypothetical protein EJ110_NYTH36670 [Nymphaea thermarum]
MGRESNSTPHGGEQFMEKRKAAAGRPSLRSLAAASVIPAAVSLAVLSSFTSCHPQKSLQPIPLRLHSHITTAGLQHTSETKSLNPLFPALHMEIPSSGRQPSERKDETEFMVDIKGDGCVSDVKSKMQTIEGMTFGDGLKVQLYTVLFVLPS